MRTSFTIASTVLAAGILSGCLSEPRYVSPEGGGLWLVAIDESTPPLVESERASVYLVEQRILFDFRRPTDEERAALSQVGELRIPYPRLPFVRRGDIEVQVDYTLSNVSDATIQVAVVLNGINEFHEYDPRVRVVDRRIVTDFAGWERTLRLEPGERRSGTIREEELDEVAVDLATVVNGAPNPNQVVYFESQSSRDARSERFIPDVVPALTGVRIGLRSQQAVPMVLELSVRVRDRRGVLVRGDDEPWPLPTPARFGPADVVDPSAP